MAAGLLLPFTAVWLATSLQPGSPVPVAERRCTPTDIIKITAGSPLHLECGSHCPTPQGKNIDTMTSSFSWRKQLDVSDGGEDSSGDSVAQLSDTADPELTIESVTHKDGGHYVCKCLPNGPECMYNVSVLPEMTFEASQLAVHYGDTFDLTCTVRGYPTNITSIQTRYGVELTNQLCGRLDAFTTRAFATVTDSEEGDFVCVSESYLLGSLVARLEKHISIAIYTPPVIIYTTEFVVRGQSDFGKAGQLACVVQTSPDTGVTVAWWVNASRIDTERSLKYHTEVVAMNPEDVLQYKLMIENVQHSDIGSYLCQLSTAYRVEDSQEAWLQVDFRKGPNEWGRTHERGEYQPSHWKGGSPSGRSDIIFFGVCSATMIGVVLVLWKLATIKKGWRQVKTTPTLNHGNLLGLSHCCSMERSLDDHAHSYGHQEEVHSFRRK